MVKDEGVAIEGDICNECSYFSLWNQIGFKSKKKNPLLILENEFMNEVRLSHSYFH